jgi:antitoxin HigA-1
MMQTKNKSFVHPGQIVKNRLKKLDLGVYVAASALNISPKQLYNVMDGTCGITPEMALRFEKAFGDKAETWMHRELEKVRIKSNRKLACVSQIKPQQVRTGHGVLTSRL